MSLAIPLYMASLSFPSSGTVLPSLGSRMDIAMRIVSAREPAEIRPAIEASRRFAESHNFDLPLPEAGVDNWVDVYRSQTVPHFVQEVRPIFSQQLRGLTKKTGITLLSFKQEDLSASKLVDATAAALVSYKAVAEFFASLSAGIDEESGALPPIVSSANTYLNGKALVQRFAIDVAFFLGVFYATRNLQLSGIIAAFGIPVVEGLSYFSGTRARDRRIGENRSRAKKIEELRVLRREISETCERLEQIKNDIPFRPESPAPLKPELRLAWILERAGLSQGDVSLLLTPNVPKEMQNTPLNYLVVELLGGNQEIRIAVPEVPQSDLYIEGEKIVGAGVMMYRTGNQIPDIMLDGINDYYPTTPKAVKNTIPSMLAAARGTHAVARAFKTLFGETANITRVDNVG